ncbi:hypothetical protein PG997_014570 [Apiospora hydei]|uniref:Uncharacterized protein n=1 Tax=Apiospora hydei TaxID=1337664 RepID=A0ABR1UU81_9PEZI
MDCLSVIDPVIRRTWDGWTTGRCVLVVNGFDTPALTGSIKQGLRKDVDVRLNDFVTPIMPHHVVSEFTTAILRFLRTLPCYYQPGAL